VERKTSILGGSLGGSVEKGSLPEGKGVENRKGWLKSVARRDDQEKRRTFSQTMGKGKPQKENRFNVGMKLDPSGWGVRG